MGKFEKLLLISDYDNTLQYTENTLRKGAPLPPIHPRNIEAIHHWMSEGGIFTVATGRTLDAFRRWAEGIPMNAPVIVDNGGSVYDFQKNTYLKKNFLAPGASHRLNQVIEKFHNISLELYWVNNPVEVVRETDWNRQHAMLTGLPYQVVERLTDHGELIKVLFVADHPSLLQLQDALLKEEWSKDYHLIFSSDHLLELTAKGADKGKMALWLKDRLDCKKLFCAGDQANDIPMLCAADRAFAPANAVPEVLSSNIIPVCHCLDGAIADAVEKLEQELAQ